ncbi:MAG: aromatic ring-hydroxylating dioxygenase subunit alpha [Actinomycetota bacterium]
MSIAKRALAHRAAGTQDQAAGVVSVPSSHYTDPERWSIEMDRVFGRLPLVVAASCELAEPGSFVSGETHHTPYLVSRGADGELRAFHNVCSHRGAIVTPPGSGVARRHTCRYHAWTYDDRGHLVGILDADDFGDIDRDCMGLAPLRCAERAGLVWIVPSDEATIDIDTFLCGYGDMLEHLELTDCHPVGRQTIAGPNWKIAYDGYLDFYHLPILHRDSFGPDMSTKALYDAWGPHQRATSPDQGFERLIDVPETEWSSRHINGGVWTIFPHVSIATMDAAGRMYMVSILSPGPDAASSTTTQLFLHTRELDESRAAIASEQMAFFERVVREEDYAMGAGVYRALRSGAKQSVLFGRNEGGGQRFHAFLDRLLETSDGDVSQLFVDAAAESKRPSP